MKATNAAVNLIAFLIGMALIAMLAAVLILEFAPNSTAAMYVDQIVNKLVVMFDL